jgi:hypothetical protein
MMPASCTMCIYYSPSLQSKDGHGICRMHPPSTHYFPQGTVSTWATVRPSDWCAEGEQGVSHDSVQAGKDLIRKSDKGNGRH